MGRGPWAMGIKLMGTVSQITSDLPATARALSNTILPPFYEQGSCQVHPIAIEKTSLANCNVNGGEHEHIQSERLLPVCSALRDPERSLAPCYRCNRSSNHISPRPHHHPPSMLHGRGGVTKERPNSTSAIQDERSIHAGAAELEGLPTSEKSCHTCVPCKLSKAGISPTGPAPSPVQHLRINSRYILKPTSSSFLTRLIIPASQTCNYHHNATRPMVALDPVWLNLTQIPLAATSFA